MTEWEDVLRRALHTAVDPVVPAGPRLCRNCEVPVMVRWWRRCPACRVWWP